MNLSVICGRCGTEFPFGDVDAEAKHHAHPPPKTPKQKLEEAIERLRNVVRTRGDVETARQQYLSAFAKAHELC